MGHVPVPGLGTVALWGLLPNTNNMNKHSEHIACGTVLRANDMRVHCVFIVFLPFAVADAFVRGRVSYAVRCAAASFCAN